MYIQNSCNTIYPRNRDCFGYINVNTLHKGDNNDNKQVQRPGNRGQQDVHIRTKFVPLITGVLGKIKKGLAQNFQLLPGHPSAIELQKVTLISTAHIIYKMVE